MKALADNSRLLLINTLIEKPQYVEEISNRLNLSPSTVSFHLKKLETAGLINKKKQQYYVVYSLDEQIFNLTLKQIINFENVEKQAQQQRIEKYRLKVLKAFFKKGKLIKLPVQHKKRLIVFNEFIKLLDPSAVYKESELNNILLNLYEDYTTIRRYLIDENILNRKNGQYWLNKNYKNEFDFSTEISSAQFKNADKSRKLKDMKTQKELKNEYKHQKINTGIFCIKNKSNGKTFIGSTVNLEGMINRIKFELKYLSFKNKELQQDYNHSSEDNFSFEIVEILKIKDDMSPREIKKKLAELEEKIIARYKKENTNLYK